MAFSGEPMAYQIAPQQQLLQVPPTAANHFNQRPIACVLNSTGYSS